jgi:hypothetical protein
MFDALPKRIVCLTEEPTEVLYALGESRRIVGISGFTVRPTRARSERSRQSTNGHMRPPARSRLRELSRIEGKLPQAYAGGCV